MPRQRCTPITKQAKINLRPHIQRHNIQQLAARAVGNTSHLLVIRGPLRLGSLFEYGRVLQHFWPPLLAVFQKQARIEFDAALDLQLCGLAVLVADLCGGGVCMLALRCGLYGIMVGRWVGGWTEWLSGLAGWEKILLQTGNGYQLCTQGENCEDGRKEERKESTRSWRAEEGGRPLWEAMQAVIKLEGFKDTVKWKLRKVSPISDS